MPILESAFSIIVKEIFKSATKQKWKSYERDHKVLAVLKNVKMAKLENDPKSIYAHALVHYGVDKETTDLVSLFAQADVRKAIERNPTDLYNALESNLHQNKELAELKIYPSVDSLQEEVEQFQNIFQTFQKQAADPFMLKMFNNMQEGMGKLLEENEKNSFEYQIEQHLENRIAEFKEKFLDKNHYIDLNGEVDVLKEALIKQSFEAGESFHERIEKGMKGEFENKKVEHCPLDTYINQWLQNTNSRFLVIMGEYGTGKTTFTKNLVYQLASQYLGHDYSRSIHDEKRRIPMWLPLLRFEKSMDNFVSSLCTNKYGITSLSYAQFQKQFEEGKFLVIYDGFDEMTQKMNTDEKRRNLQQLRSLFDKGSGSKIILTCRKEYFQTEAEKRQLFNAPDTEVVNLMPFDEGQIKQFLRSHSENPDELWDEIQNIKGLHDISKRPVLLDMLVEHLPDLLAKRIDGKPIKATDLYEACINKELERKLHVRMDISIKDRHRVLSKLATWMYVNDTLVFDVREIGAEIDFKEEFQAQTSSEVENRLNQFLAFTFLIWDNDYQFRLSHKSFRDYLTAQAFVKEINSGNIQFFSKAKLTDELQNFLLEQPLDKAILLQLILTAKSLNEENQWQGTNAASLLLKMDEKALAGQNLAGCLLREVDFSGCHLKGTSFHSAVLSGASFTKTIFEADSVVKADTMDCLLDITNENLTTLEAIEALTGLAILFCGINQVSDLSPVSGLSNLKQLVCDSNQISDLSPLSGLSNLERLVCDSNQINDLSHISRLYNLYELQCYFNGIRDLSPVSELPFLKILWCFTNQISDLSPVSGLTNLQELWCDANQISDLSPISGLINLQSLSCEANQISDLSPISGLTNLRSLRLGFNQISDLSPILGLINLQSLNCEENQIGDLSPVNGLTNLNKLRCDYNYIVDLSPVEGLFNLQTLICSINQISILSPLAGLANLKELFIRMEGFDNNAQKTLKEALPNTKIRLIK